MKVIEAPRKNLETHAIKILEQEIKKLLKNKEYITLGIPGGNSVKGIFKKLKSAKIPWEKIHVFMVDERQVPLTNKQSNYKLAKETFIDYLIEKKKFISTHVHPYYYKRTLKDYENDLIAHKGKFDIVILSSGEDGHVAGLFPEKSIKDKSNYFIKIDDSPKPPKKRMTASRKLLEKSSVAILLFFGKEKQQAYRKFKDKKLSVNKCPAKLVNEIKKNYVLTTS